MLKFDNTFDNTFDHLIIHLIIHCMFISGWQGSNDGRGYVFGCVCGSVLEEDPEATFPTRSDRFPLLPTEIRPLRGKV